MLANQTPKCDTKSDTRQRQARPSPSQGEEASPKANARRPGRLIEGATTQGWKQALNALALAYPDRFANYIH